jgi:hypothetical protein
MPKYLVSINFKVGVKSFDKEVPIDAKKAKDAKRMVTNYFFNQTPKLLRKSFKVEKISHVRVREKLETMSSNQRRRLAKKNKENK